MTRKSIRHPLGWSPWFFGILLSLCVGAWFGLQWLQQQGQIELAKTRQIGSVTLIPEGFESDGWLRYRWSKFTVVFPSGQVVLVKPVLTLRLATGLPYFEHLRLETDSLKVTLDPKSTRKAKKPGKPFDWVFPELSLPLKVLVESPYAQVDVKGVGFWKLDSLQLRNPGRTEARVQFRQAKGKYLADPVNSEITFNWSGKFVELDARFDAPTDSLQVFAEGPKEGFDDLSVEIALISKNPKQWVPIALPKEVPSVRNIRLHSQTHITLRDMTAQWSAETEFQMGAVPKLSASHVKTELKGDLKGNVDGHILWEGEDGARMEFDASRDFRNHIQLTGDVTNLMLRVGSQQLPADAHIQEATLSGDTLNASVLTASGSQVNARLVNFKDPMITMNLNVSPTEPWATSWCDGNLQIGAPATIEGEFYRGILTANVKAAIPYAYKATAESFETDLTLSSKGIHFDNGAFITRGVEHRFQGEVIWDSSQEHFQFEIQQDSGGLARVFGDFEGHVSLNVSQLPTQKLPLADTTLLHGVKAVVTGNWEQRFAAQYGILRLAVETDYKGLPVQINITARQNLDSLILESLDADASGNKLQANGLALIDTTKTPSVALEQVSIVSNGFSLPGLLQGLGDSTLAEAILQGQFNWNRTKGFDGRFSIADIHFRKIPSDFLRIQRFELLGSGDQLQASARLRLGPDGMWDSEAEVNLKGIFDPMKGLAAAIVSDHGGILWLEGVLDSNWAWNGDVHMEGSWYLPSDIGEIRDTKFNSHMSIDPKNGLQGIQAKFKLDTALFYSPGFEAPFRLQGSIEQGLLNIDSLRLYGEKPSRIDGNLSMDLVKKELRDLHFASESFHLEFGGMHRILLEHFSGNAMQKNQEMQISILLPKIEYRLNDKSMGKAYGRASGNLLFRMPLQSDSIQHTHRNSRIEGRVEIERLTYDKSMEIDPTELGSLFQKATQSIKNLGKKPIKSERKSKDPGKKSKPTELDIRILDPGRDSLLVRTSVARFPFTLDVQVQGTTEDPLLTGDINSVGVGFLGYETLADFDLQTLRISWQDQAPKKGQVDALATTDIPYCEENEEGRIETCPVTLNISGPLTEPNPMPYANCIVESSPAQIYYAVIILGCFPSATSSSFDVNGAGGKLLGMVATKGINKTLGGDYVGSIGLKWRIKEGGTTVDQRDSNYIRIPVKLDRWVKNLSFVVGFSQDQSQNPRYDQSYDAGLKYSMPVLDSGEHIQNHVDPTLDFSGSLIQRRYQATLDGSSQESRLEKNIGVAYSWRFWDYCFFGFGNCPEQKQPTKKESK